MFSMVIPLGDCVFSCCFSGYLIHLFISVLQKKVIDYNSFSLAMACTLLLVL